MEFHGQKGPDADDRDGRRLETLFACVEEALMRFRIDPEEVNNGGDGLLKG